MAFQNLKDGRGFQCKERGEQPVGVPFGMVCPEGHGRVQPHYRPGKRTKDGDPENALRYLQFQLGTAVGEDRSVARIETEMLRGVREQYTGKAITLCLVRLLIS